MALSGVALGIAALVLLRGVDPSPDEPATSRAEAAGVLPSAGLPSAGLPSVGLPSVGLPSVGLPSVGLPSVGLPSFVVPQPAAAAPADPLPAAAAPQAVVEPAPPEARPALTVFNNSRIPQLGARAAARYRAGGWPVASVHGLRGRIRATTVYYDPGQREQAQALAAAFDLPRLLPRFDGLPGHGLTVVVTRDSPAARETQPRIPGRA